MNSREQISQKPYSHQRALADQQVKQTVKLLKNSAKLHTLKTSLANRMYMSFQCSNVYHHMLKYPNISIRVSTIIHVSFTPPPNFLAGKLQKADCTNKVISYTVMCMINSSLGLQ